MDSETEYLTPDDVTDIEFESKRRGLDPGAVSAHLHAVRETVRTILSDNAALRDEIAQLRRDDRVETESEVVDLDEDVLRRRLGEEAVAVLERARAEADDIRAEAERDAITIRAEAETLFATRSAAADEETERHRTREHESLRHDRHQAEDEARRLVTEAQIVRRQILEDLARRRSLARRQIEQLRAGRERLIASHDVLRRTLDELSTELSVSMSEARAAAETAGHSVPETSIEDLEAEIETARLSGLLDTGPVPIVAAADDDEGGDDRRSEAPADDRRDDPVEIDPTVADLFERMRSSQRNPRPDSDPRVKDRLSQR